MLILWGTLALARGRTWAWVGLMILLANPLFVNFGSLQLADVPLGVCFMTAWALVVLATRPGGGASMGWWIAAGALFGMTGWIKNEGLLMILASAIGLAVLLPWKHWRTWAKLTSWRQASEGIALLAGLAPFAIAIVWAKLMHAASNDRVRGQSMMDTLHKPWSLSRHTLILEHYWNMLRHDGPLWCTVLLVALLLLAGWNTRQRSRPLRGMGAAILLTAAGYYLVYLLTPLDLNWHLTTSLGRVLTQLWPAFVLWAMLGMKHGSGDAGGLARVA
jgi:hypothetical protein